MKTCNFIIYHVGQGGNLLRFLLSLHKNTFPLSTQEGERHEQYSFKNLRWRFGSWANYETSEDWQRIPSDARLLEFSNQDVYNTLTLAEHPDELYSFVDVAKIYNQLTKINKVNWLTVTVSPKYEDMIEDFLKKNQRTKPNYFPLKGSTRYTTSRHLMEKYIQEFEPYCINLDAFFEGEQEFLTEYKFLLNHLNYEISDVILSNALELYRGWYQSRELNR